MLIPVTKKTNPKFRGMASQSQIDANSNLQVIDLIALATAMAMDVEVPVIVEPPKVEDDDKELNPSKIKRKP